MFYILAKTSRSISFRNCEIDVENDIIMEVTKDEVRTYVLSKQLESWAGLTGVSITIKLDDDIPSEDADVENSLTERKIKHTSRRI